MNCPNCKGKAESRAGVIVCNTCGGFEQAGDGSFIPADIPAAETKPETVPADRQADSEPKSKPDPEKQAGRRSLLTISVYETADIDDD